MSENLNCNNQSRIDWIDSVKGILIFLVVFGHFIGFYAAQKINVLSITHYLIYSVHMPIFIFLSGFLSKKKSSFEKIFKNLIIPYIIFDLIYVLASRALGGEGNFNILFPTYLYWYILCIAIMRLSVDFMDKTRLAYFTPVISIAVCCFCPENLWRFLSLGRVLLLFPIFYLGYKLDKKWLLFFREKKWLSIIIAAAAILAEILLLKFSVTDISFATHDYPLNISNHLVKLLFMLFSVFSFALLAAFVPQQIKFLKRWGKNSIIIYLFHPYAIILINKLLPRFMPDSNIVRFIVLIMISVAVTEILSLNIFFDIYIKIFGYINKGIDFVKGKLIKS